MVKKASNNDSVILGLKKQIEDKKKALKSVEGFKPATNCSLIIEGERLNLHINNTDSLTMALVKLNALRMSALDLGIADFEYQGYKLSDWVNDIRSRLLIMNKLKEEARLKALEAKVTELLSLDKKTELLLDDLAGQI